MFQYFEFYVYTIAFSYSCYSKYSSCRLLPDCPRNVVFRGQHENFAINSSLSCISDAHPTAEYRWNIINGSGFAEGQFFVIDSPGYFNISCTAYNFLRPPDDECTAPTLYTTGYVLSSRCRPTGITPGRVLSHFTLDFHKNLRIIVVTDVIDVIFALSSP